MRRGAEFTKTPPHSSKGTDGRRIYRYAVFCLVACLFFFFCAPRAACNYRVLAGLDLRLCGVIK
jgi:hypothetical protein